MSAKAQITEQYLADGLGNVLGEIFARRRPGRGLRDRDLNGAQDRVGRSAAQYIAAAFDRLGPLGYIAKRDIWDAEY